ncbi:hypothetical protein [Marivita hallyeonensis]|uniref:Uncharacterized protein n=1 Tax=Marivita hallyeonensis TaxID=996342 RepID=A0A1M5RME1_9RHOB|nr:hypothetical protein [Marivita hallyeonensis]SHH27494.1 hypothetical protein SAMN05443551_1816 [Marivita hallyeonensis]
MTADLMVRTRDVAREAYHVVTPHGAAFVPECLMDKVPHEARPSHQTAYEWIGAHRRQITSAVEALKTGRTPRAPYDLITLIEES